MGYVEYSVSIDLRETQNQFGKFSPYNVLKDVKEHKISRSMLEYIAEDIADELKRGWGRSACEAIYWGELRMANYSKIRVGDRERNTGGSNGYRCIVLVDKINNFAFILHIYRHGHGEAENISAKDKNKLKTLVDKYIHELKEADS